MTDWFGVGGFIPHGFCMAWESDLVVAVLLSNGLIALAYMVISGGLVMKAIEPAPRLPAWLYWGFAAFIFFCGISHVLDDVTLWFPVYRLQAVVLGITALVSLFAAIVPISIWIGREAGRRH